MRICNLYCGIGGNRRLWEDVDVTSVELNPKIAAIYQDFFPQDKVIVADAHSYLLEHFEEYDFIWSSPPCQSHSSFRKNICVRYRGTQPVYPDLKLYEEILFLKQIANSSGTKFKGNKYCVENVVSYYKPLITPQEVARHYFWANFSIRQYQTKTRGHMESNKKLSQIKGFNINNKTLLRNCVEPELGLHILNESKINRYPELFNNQKEK